MKPLLIKQNCFLSIVARPLRSCQKFHNQTKGKAVAFALAFSLLESDASVNETASTHFSRCNQTDYVRTSAIFVNRSYHYKKNKQNHVSCETNKHGTGKNERRIECRENVCSFKELLEKKGFACSKFTTN